jgi:hypothetical protein
MTRLWSRISAGGTIQTGLDGSSVPLVVSAHHASTLSI